VHDVGDGHQARVVKLCTNLLIAITAEALSEATVLGERSGVRRPELLAFINDSAIGSTFSKYKSEALVDLDFTPSFSPEGQRKDLRLALDLGRDGGVSMPVAAATEVVFSQLIGSGLGADRDFIALVLQVARDSGITLAAEPPP
jgi:3-hydroxyisobutyrate dehydrogenase